MCIYLFLDFILFSNSKALSLLSYCLSLNSTKVSDKCVNVLCAFNSGYLAKYIEIPSPISFQKHLSHVQNIYQLKYFRVEMLYQ